MKIIADAHIPYVSEYFSAHGDLVLLPGREISSRDVHDADIVLVRSITTVNQALLEHSSVQFVGSVTAGIDHLDTIWLDSKKIAWGAARGFNAPPVADYVISVVAALQKKRLLPVKNLQAAVVGVGCVGQLVQKQLQAINVTTVLCDPIRAESEVEFEHAALDDIADVDLICLHVPLTHAGKHKTAEFITRDFLARQKPGCILLNASRGGVIHAEALAENGSHLRWCFDVWDHEPSIDLHTLQQVVIGTPHIAGYSLQSKRRGIEMIYQLVCDKGLILPKSAIIHEMPHQTLEFSGQVHQWQDIVLGIFNPLVMTALMRATLEGAENVGDAFDMMRNHFNYRHEFAHTKIVAEGISDTDAAILGRLKIYFE